jgi:hypothetical protein
MRSPRAYARLLERRRLAGQDGHGVVLDGFGLMSLVLDSGHVLAFRRITGSSMGPPFTSVWHRDPDGRWTLHINVSPTRSYARYFGGAMDAVEQSEIDVVWKRHHELSIYVRAARLHLTLRLAASSGTRLATAAAALLPARLWQVDASAALVGRAAGSALRAGPLVLHGSTLDGHHYQIRPRAFWRVEAAAVALGCGDLGGMVEPADAPAFGGYVMPRRPLFVVGSAHFQRRGDGQDGS